MIFPVDHKKLFNVFNVMILKVGSSKCRSAAPQNNRKCSVSNSAGHILNQDSRDGSQQAMF